MSILINEFLAVLENLAPASLAEEWDNVGLQLGSRADSVERVLVALDVTDAVLAEAVTQDCGLILSHHPLIFQPLASASDDSGPGRLLRAASRAGVALVTAHTNLDSAPQGLADTLAEMIDLQKAQPLSPAPARMSKLVVFVPAGDLEAVRTAIFAAGAGVIGDYQHCSYTLEGKGTFLPMEGADPTIGEVGRDERVAETRLEAVFPREKQAAVVEALTRAHSYEEPAYDIYALENHLRDAGAGRVGELASEMQLKDFASRMAELFAMEEARFSGDPERPVRRVAVVPGSGAGYIGVCGGIADVLVTGDIKYHQAQEAAELGLALVDIPHDISEGVALGIWAGRLERRLAAHKVEVKLSAPPPSLWQAVPGREARAAEASGSKQQSITLQEENSMFHLHVDGGSRGNPGPAGIGAVLADESGEVVETLSDFIGVATNNVAEYQALISGVEMAMDRGVTQLVIFSDSELIVRQIEGRYRVKNEGLRPYYQQAKSLLSRLGEYEIKSVPREANAHADELVNEALDEAAKF